MNKEEIKKGFQRLINYFGQDDVTGFREFLEKFIESYASAPTREVTEEDVRNFIDKYFESTKGSPNDIEDAIKETVKWLKSNTREVEGGWISVEDEPMPRGERLWVIAALSGEQSKVWMWKRRLEDEPLPKPPSVNSKEL